jgi:ppGpp synthetase/RelA/SpoT-type nucleotidyltranferase
MQNGEFPNLEFDKQQIVQAGEALSGDLIWNDNTAEHIRQVFRIANNWRDSHIHPMRRLRHELMGNLRSLKVRGITAARLKRMRSIRKKLQTQPIKLDRIQDLAGCRAIVPNISDVNAVVDRLRTSAKHKLHRETDYINKPRSTGYRSHHIIFEFRPEIGEEIFDGRRVEIQIRTRLQHSWATAVEAVGLFRREDLKGSRGDDSWLRLFQLMSQEFALAEGCLEESVEARAARVREIRDLEQELEATNTLENLSQAVRFTESYYMPANARTEFFLIRYNNADNRVSVEPYSNPYVGARSYDSAESSDNRTGKNSLTAVLVEVDKIENLREAYPNYFGDVQLFNSNLKQITQGDHAQEFVLPPQKVVPPKPKEKIDYSWLYSYRRWK